MGWPSGRPEFFSFGVGMDKVPWLFLLAACLLVLAIAFIPVGNHLSLEKNAEGNWRIHAIREEAGNVGKTP